MVVFDGAFTVENTYGNVKVATDPTAGADWTRRGLHTRPRSESLNLAVQDVFDTSIAERGINESLVHFIPEHVTHKEQQVTWIRLIVLGRGLFPEKNLVYRDM